jgi:flagellar hook-associated protein 1 FlgK
MSLESALSIASGGLANINAQFAVISQNVANASTPGYAAETVNQVSLTADGIPMGVQTMPPGLKIDPFLQASLTAQNATVTGLQTTQTALQAIDGVLGTPASGNDLGSLTGKLQDSFSTLLTDPSSQTQQSAVVSAANTLARGINALSNAYGAQRQAVQNDLGAAAGQVNQLLSSIGQLSDQIVALKPTSLGTADLQNQRNAAVQTLSGLLDVKTAEQPNGDLLVFTPGGLTLPTHQPGDALTVPGGQVPASAYYPGGGIGGIMLGGTDVTAQLIGGRIGADIALRDTALPTSQAELDEFAEGLSTRFASQGLTLFTDGSGAVPSSAGPPVQSGYTGYAGVIQVNPNVTANPALVRDGTNAVPAIGFTPNPPGGPAGFTQMIQNVLGSTFGSSQPALNTASLGPAGNLTAPFSTGANTLADYATGLVSAQSQQSATVTASVTSEQALQTSLQSKLSAVSGVNMDTEMSTMLSLQNAYSANARILSAARAMFNDLAQVVQ